MICSFLERGVRNRGQGGYTLESQLDRLQGWLAAMKAISSRGQESYKLKEGRRQNLTIYSGVMARKRREISGIASWCPFPI